MSYHTPLGQSSSELPPERPTLATAIAGKYKPSRLGQALFIGGLLGLVLWSMRSTPRRNPRRNPTEAQLLKKVLDLSQELRRERDPVRRESLKTRIDWYNHRLHKKAPTKYPPIEWVMARRSYRGW